VCVRNAGRSQNRRRPSSSTTRKGRAQGRSAGSLSGIGDPAGGADSASGAGASNLFGAAPPGHLTDEALHFGRPDHHPRLRRRLPHPSRQALPSTGPYPILTGRSLEAVRVIVGRQSPTGSRPCWPSLPDPRDEVGPPGAVLSVPGARAPVQGSRSCSAASQPTLTESANRRPGRKTGLGAITVYLSEILSDVQAPR